MGGTAQVMATVTAVPSQKWLSIVTGLGVLTLIYIVIAISGRNWNCRKLVEGADGRVSISKFLWLIWMTAILCSYTTLFVLRAEAGGYSATSQVPFNLLIVYGFSAGIAVAEKRITDTRIRGNRVSKATPINASGGRPQGNLFHDDGGVPDLAKVQILGFTLIAVTIFLATFGRQILSNPIAASLPDLNPSLTVLIGISQASYLGKEFVSAASPASKATRPPKSVATASAWLILVGAVLAFVQSFGPGFARDAAQWLFWFEALALLVFDFTWLVLSGAILVNDGRNLIGAILDPALARISKYPRNWEPKPSPVDGATKSFGARWRSAVLLRILVVTSRATGFLAQFKARRPLVSRAITSGTACVAAAGSGLITALGGEAVFLSAAVSLGVLTVAIAALQGDVPVGRWWWLRPQSGDVWERAVDVVEAESAAEGFQVRVHPGDTSAGVVGPRPGSRFSAHAEDRMNVGIVRASRPGVPIIKGPLAADEDHMVWVSIGPSDSDAVPGAGPPLDLSEVDTGQLLDVVLFADEALLVPDAPRAGRFVVGPARPLRVQSPAEQPFMSEALVGTRLYFRVHTPALSGHYKVRACVYHRNTLLQVRQVTLPVGRSRAQLASITPYAIVRSPSARGVTELAERRLSLYINESGDGSHDFWVRGQAGEEDWHRAGHLGEGEVGALARLVREPLRQVSWGTTAENQGQDNLYPAGESDRFNVKFEKLEADLIMLAQRGYEAWDLIIDKLGGDSEYMRDRMRQRGIVEIAPRINSNVIPPVAGLYDLHVDAGAKVSDMSLCPEAEKALRDGSDLALTSCFTNGCVPASKFTVCPSGFWGLRHDIAVPLSHAAAPDSTPRLRLGAGSPGAILVGTVPESVEKCVTDHAGKVAGRFWKSDHVVGRVNWLAKAEVTDLYAVLYFLCHGEEQRGGPALVLDQLGEQGIGRSDLRGVEKALKKHNPLVVMNACNTGALAPDKAIDLVGGFTARGAGAIIGTEIAIFPSLAYAFADAFMNAFVGTSAAQPTEVWIGSAVRAARLELLRRWNPLGLVYVLYGLADATLGAPVWATQHTSGL